MPELVVIGIDPAATSGLAVFSGPHLTHSATVKVKTARDCMAALRPFEHADVVYIEGQWVGGTNSREGRGKAQGALKTSAKAGWWEAAAQLLGIRTVVIPVATWRAVYKIRGGREHCKAEAIRIASQRWGITQTDAAEAALIGLAGYVHETQRCKN